MSRFEGLPPYPSYLHMHFHPGRLGAMASLRGIDPPQMERSRMLDIGCGDGTSLLNFAFGLRNAEFVGIDLDEAAIAAGNAAATELGLANVKLHAMDGTKVDESFGTFDYVVMHGLYAWVPPSVRQGVWDVARQRLSPNGLVYVSFNAQPGSHFREASRRMMLYHTRHSESPEDVVRESQAIQKFIAAGDYTGHVYREMLKDEASVFLERRPDQVLFDELAEHYSPLYLHEFLDDAAKAGFEYIAESSYSEMSLQTLPQGMRRTIESIKDLPVRMQYRDFFTGCRFHRTILCRQDRPLGVIDATRLMDANVVAPIRLVKRDETTGTFEFCGERGAEIRTSDELQIFLLSALADAYPKPTRVRELLGRIAALDEAGVRKACTTLLELSGLESATFSLFEPAYCEKPGDRPVSSPIARRQTRLGYDTPSLFGVTIEVQDPKDRRLLELADGAHDRAALCDELEISGLDLAKRLEYFGRHGFMIA